MSREKKYQTPYITIDSSKCLGRKCMKCIDVCPKQVFGEGKFLFLKYFKFGDPNACIGCMKCARICPGGVFIKKKK